MQCIYAYEEAPDGVPSIFLAGPSPRKEAHHNWRPEALETLGKLSFSGSVFIPLPRDGVWSEYEEQVSWELEHLNMADVIIFWIPRSEDLPAYTTNVEFGYFVASGKCILGAPENAPKMKYLQHLARIHDLPVETTLESTLRKAVSRF